ncbi:MAG: sortase [Oscillospiraceae bacterium]|nr:sortase [Oscillospiraceae bacterium]
MNKRFGLLLMLFGALLMTASMVLYLHNVREDREAGERAQQVVEQMKPSPTPIPMVEVSPTPKPPKTTMPVVEIDGNGYIGYVAIPTLEIELPVMSDWSYEKLHTAPCRHAGATYSEDLVIAAHNYDKHFGGLKDLQPDDSVTFTDMDGDVYTYRVALVETVAPTAVEQVLESDYALVLYTCTYGGKTRVAVFCEILK